MTVGYRIAGGTDLDAVFKARTSAAIANVGFRNSAGTDLSQLYEPRGSATPVANTGFRNSAAVDFAQLFQSITAVVSMNFNMTAAQYTPSIITGYHNGDGAIPAFGSISATAFGSSTIATITYNFGGPNCQLTLYQIGVYPPDTDQSWQGANFTGIFADSAGLTVTRSISRAGRTSTQDTVASTHNRRTWYYGGNAMQFVNGNTYTCVITRVP